MKEILEEMNLELVEHIVERNCFLKLAQITIQP